MHIDALQHIPIYVQIKENIFLIRDHHCTFKLTAEIDGRDISVEIALREMSLDLTDDESTLVGVMVLCRQAIWRH